MLIFKHIYNSSGSRIDACQNEKGGYSSDFLNGVWDGLQTICVGKFADVCHLRDICQLLYTICIIF